MTKATSARSSAAVAHEEKMETKEDSLAAQQQADIETVCLSWPEEIAFGANAPNPCELSASSGEGTCLIKCRCSRELVVRMSQKVGSLNYLFSVICSYSGLSDG